MNMELILICLISVLCSTYCFFQSKGVICIYKAGDYNRVFQDEKLNDQARQTSRLYQVSYTDKEYLCEKTHEEGEFGLKEDHLKDYINFADSCTICQINFSDVLSNYTNPLGDDKIQFLVEGKAKAYDWQITTDTMTIDGSLCYKAFFKEKSSSGIPLLYTAWFCPDIPIPIGPCRYYGLPGLILRLVLPYQELRLQSIVYTDDVKMEKPKEGKKISEKDYKAFVEEYDKNIRKMSESNQPIISHGQL